MGYKYRHGSKIDTNIDMTIDANIGVKGIKLCAYAYKYKCVRIRMHVWEAPSQQALLLYPNVVPGPNKYAPYLYLRALINFPGLLHIL